MDEFVQTNEKVAAIIQQHFLIMKVNYSDENENKKFLEQFPKVPAYPHYFVLDSDGQFLHSQGTGELEKGKSYDETVFATFLNNWIGKTAEPPAKEPGLSHLDRSILKEPDYAGPPEYCLLVFGSNAETQVWLVADGETIYLDRNANGDLTDDGETLQPTQGSGSGDRKYEKIDIVPIDGTAKQTEFEIGCFQSSAKEIHHYIKVNVNGELQQFAGWRSIFADSPESAKILHFGGKFGPRPLRKHELSLTEKDQELHLSIVINGLGENSRTMLGYTAVPPTIIPIAQIEWPTSNLVDVQTEV